jgi:hypothetical protein
MDPTLSGQSAYRGQLGCQPYMPAMIYFHKYLLVLISVRGCKSQSHGVAGSIR